MKIKIHELASQEFDDAIEWYNLQSKELGNRFKKAVICQLKKNQANARLVFIRNRRYF